MPSTSDHGIKGLTSQQVSEARALHGRNEVIHEENNVLSTLKDLFKDPMLLLLLVASLLYFISGEIGNGVFMISAIFLVIGISLYQESRSRNALAALKSLTQPTSKVIRNGVTLEIKREEIVVGDFMIVEEGSSIPADGIIVQSNDFSVNESILTGESMPLSKNKEEKNNEVFQGTTVAGGLAICEVNAIGATTSLGKIGKSLESIDEEDTPLQKQIGNFVKKMAFAGAIVFFIVWGIYYFRSHEIVSSLLKALTLAMSILPEEIPVAFTTFMALGAWRLMKLGIIVKHTKTVETLGSATVICTDKTGTITENRMSLAKLFVLATNKIVATENATPEEKELITVAMWASEPIPFDPMEIALHDAYGKSTAADLRNEYHMIHEYPLGGRPPMMTHVFENATASERIIAAKGAPEAMMQVADLSEQEKKNIFSAIQTLAEEGFRVLGVGVSTFIGNSFPESQQQLKSKFMGLVAFYDPPKKNIASVFDSFYKAGIAVKIITGDNAATTSTIARQIGFKGTDKTMSGEELLKLGEEELKAKVMEVNIFTRMFPDAKLRILNALKANQQIVAMTGDGVNDAPSLKMANIGVAMGITGTDVSKQAADMILLDDNFATIVKAVREGRRIFDNIQKFIRYIMSGNAGEIWTILLAPLVGLPIPLLPIHILWINLVTDGLPSLALANESAELNIMQRPPRSKDKGIFSNGVALHILWVGLLMGALCLGIQAYAIHQGSDRWQTMVFTTLSFCQLAHVFAIRSFDVFIYKHGLFKNRVLLFIVIPTVILQLAIIYVPFLHSVFHTTSLTTSELLICFAAAAIVFHAVEIEKWIRHQR